MADEVGTALDHGARVGVGAELREHGQVRRRVDEFDIDANTWRAEMRRAARRKGMRIRTLLVEPPAANPPEAELPAGPATLTDSPRWMRYRPAAPPAARPTR